MPCTVAPAPGPPQGLEGKCAGVLARSEHLELEGTGEIAVHQAPHGQQLGR